MTDIAIAPQYGEVQPARGDQLPELGSDSRSAQAVAVAQAKFAVAARFPRDIDNFRTKLLAECRRTRFAETSRYRLPYGKTRAEGWTIRFVETATRLFRNIDCTSRTVHDGPHRIIVECSATDMESIVSWTREISIDKTVERRDPKNAGDILGTRLNTYGDTVYIIKANEREVAQRVGAEISKTLRALALRMLPADILDEARDIVLATERQADTRDPDAARKKLLDSFASIGIEPSDLVAYLGHGTKQITPAEMTDLRAIYQSVRAGESSWTEVTQKDEPKPKKRRKSKTERLLDERNAPETPPAEIDATHQVPPDTEQTSLYDEYGLSPDGGDVGGAPPDIGGS